MVKPGHSSLFPALFLLWAVVLVVLIEGLGKIVQAGFVAARLEVDVIAGGRGSYRL